MKKKIVNGKEVEYLYINDNNPDKIIVEFSEKFNIVDAHMSEIMKRLRENDLRVVHIHKDFKHDIITILFTRIEDVHGILHSLSVPPNCYEIDDEDPKFKIIIIDIPILQEKIKGDKDE